MVQWDKFIGYRSDYGKGTRVRIPLATQKKKKKHSLLKWLPDGGWSGMGNSYRHGLGHKCSRWRPRVHPVNTYLHVNGDLGWYGLSVHWLIWLIRLVRSLTNRFDMAPWLIGLMRLVRSLTNWVDMAPWLIGLMRLVHSLTHRVDMAWTLFVIFFSFIYIAKLQCIIETHSTHNNIIYIEFNFSTSPI